MNQRKGLVHRHVQAAADGADEVHASGFQARQVGHHGGQFAVGDGQRDLVVQRTRGLAVGEQAGCEVGQIAGRAQGQADLPTGAHQVHRVHMQRSQLCQGQAADRASKIQDGFDLCHMRGVQRRQLRDQVAGQAVDQHRLAGGLGLQHQGIGGRLGLDLRRQLAAEALHQLRQLLGRCLCHGADGIEQHALRGGCRGLGVGHQRDGGGQRFGVGCFGRRQQPAGFEHGKPAFAAAIGIGDGVQRVGQHAVDRRQLGRVADQRAQSLADQAVEYAGGGHGLRRGPTDAVLDLNLGLVLDGRTECAHGVGQCRFAHGTAIGGSRSRALEQRIDLLLRREDGQPQLRHG